jgi:hypothetical protein
MKSKKLSKDQKIGIGLGLLGAGIIGYLFFSSSTASAATSGGSSPGTSTGGGSSAPTSGGGVPVSGGGGTTSSGDQSYTLGSGGSGTPLPGIVGGSSGF